MTIEKSSTTRGASGGRSGNGAEMVEDIFSLSPLQQGMLFHMLSDPGQGLYLEQTVCSFEADLDVAAFQSAWQKVVDRHPALRTGFLWKDLTKPVQVVHRNVSVGITDLDWRDSSDSAQQDQLIDLLEEDRATGFDLSVPPLLRLTLLRRSQTSYWLLWSVTHLVVDAWCSSVVLDEVVRCYEAQRTGKDLPLPPAPSYGQYVRWIKSQDDDASQPYWREQLRGFHEPSHLQDRAASDSWPGTACGYFRVGLSLEAVDTSALRELARAHQLTLNTVVQGAWALLLSFASGSDDVVFGKAVSGRSIPLEGIEGMVGPLINTLPQRVLLDRERTLLEWLGDLQRRQTEMQEHEHTPLARVQSWSEVANGGRLFESIFVFLNVADPSQQETGSLRLEDLRYLGRPHYPLSVHVTPGKCLSLEMVYDSRSYRPEAVSRWLKMFSSLLEEIPSRPYLLLEGALDLLQRADRSIRQEHRRRRRESNIDRLRDTKPIKVQVQDPQ
ncbi:MAG: hypothetical protein K0U98_08950 [Deltaproteobacteria bacterium]|nr:hypothetical protein [Deltaproteobacteria bacterium]